MKAKVGLTFFTSIFEDRKANELKEQIFAECERLKRRKLGRSIRYSYIFRFLILRKLFNDWWMQCCQTRIYLDRSCWFMAWVSYSTVYWAYSPLQITNFYFCKKKSRNYFKCTPVLFNLSRCEDQIHLYRFKLITRLYKVQPCIQFNYDNPLKFPIFLQFFLIINRRSEDRKPFILGSLLAPRPKYGAGSPNLPSSSFVR